MFDYGKYVMVERDEKVTCGRLEEAEGRESDVWRRQRRKGRKKKKKVRCGGRW